MIYPEVSVIIINYNTYNLTCQCIQSIYKHEEQNNYEIILVDNASVECDPDKFKHQFPDINLIKSDKNLGFAGGNNLGINKAKGEYILLLNSDTELINNAVTLACQIMENDDSIGVLSGHLQYPDGSLQSVAGRFPSIKRELRELFRVNKKLTKQQRADYFLGTEWDYTKPTKADWVWGAFFMFLKSDLQHFPKHQLHDDFFMYGEDVQWCYHFKKVLKKKILYSPEPKAIHYIGGSDKNKAEPLERYKQKMLPHEYQWLCMVKGKLYARLYYFSKSMVYFSLREIENYKKATLYLKIALKGI